MSNGPDEPICFRLLLLEAKPESLAVARNSWPEAEILARSLDQVQGVTDQISREKVQMIICDLTGDDCPGLNVLKQIRRVHPQLPLVAVLPEQTFTMTLSAFRNGANDVLVHPLD